MIKTETNITVRNAAGYKTKANVLVEQGGGSYTSGDILDANASEKLIDKRIADVIGLAPETLDTLQEVAEVIEDHGQRIEDLETSGGGGGIKFYEAGDVLYKDGSIVKPAEIPAKQESGVEPIAVCVAGTGELADGAARFSSLKLMIYNGDFVITWENVPMYYTPTGLTNYGTKETALTDIDGISNTKILSTLSGPLNAAKACAEYLPGVYNGEWYLPALGELNYMYLNYEKIRDTLNLLGIHINNIYKSGIWASTQYDSDNAWTEFLYIEDADDTNFGLCEYYNKGTTGFALAFVSIGNSISEYINNHDLQDKPIGKNTFVENGDLYQIKDFDVYPVSHPDLSTQPSILPQRYGNLKIYEVLIPLGNTFTDVQIDHSYMPANATVLECSVFCNKYKLSAFTEKTNSGWKISAYGFLDTDESENNWVALVRYMIDCSNYGYSY